MTRSRAASLLQAEPGPAVFLRFQNAAFRGGRGRTFSDVNWTWHIGEQWAVFGAEHSGKSLLIDALRGRAVLARGRIQTPLGTHDEEPTHLHDAIAVVSPETQRQLILRQASFYQSRWHSGLAEGQRTVADLLSQDSVEERNPFEVGARLGDPSRFAARRRQVVRWLGVGSLSARHIAHLSNGELRKTLIAFALLREPRLLILEDPLAGLDVATRATLQRVIADLMKGGLPVLVVTHRLNEIPAPTTHLLLLEGNRIVAQGAKHLLLPRCRKVLTSLPPPSVRSTPIQSPIKASNAKSGVPLVELRNVTVAGQGRRILRNVTWTLREGERWVFLGPNGAGKTTLLNLIQGDHPQAYSQDLRLFGRTPDTTQTVWQSRQLLGWMSPELHQHYPAEWSAQDVVASGYFNTLGLFDPCSRPQRTSARAWLRRLGLADRVSEFFGALSFGQQRLTLLARAVVKRPRLVILDEPCQGLDAAQRALVLAAVDQVMVQTACSLIFVTHRVREVPACMTHLLRLDRGRIRAAGPISVAAEVS